MAVKNTTPVKPSTTGNKSTFGTMPPVHAPLKTEVESERLYGQHCHRVDPKEKGRAGYR